MEKSNRMTIAGMALGEIPQRTPLTRVKQYGSGSECPSLPTHIKGVYVKRYGTTRVSMRGAQDKRRVSGPSCPFFARLCIFPVTPK